MSYTTLLFDADNTILDFNKTEYMGLTETFARYGLPFNTEIFRIYEKINHQLWADFEKGKVDKPTLLATRFRKTFDVLGITGVPEEFEEEYQLSLGRGAYPIEGIEDILRQLIKTHRMYVVTNGVLATQVNRMKKSGLDRYFEALFISDAIGFQKPQKEYFDYVFAHIPNFCPEETLLIGDSLNSDILGGIRAGIDTCWYNPKGAAHPPELSPTYIITDLKELLNQC